LYNSIDQGKDGQINEVDWSPDGQYFSVASNGVTVYQFNTLNPIWSQSFAKAVNTAKFSKLGQYLAVGTNSNDTVFIYNVPGFTLNMSLPAFQVGSENVYEVDFSPDDTKLVACGTNSYVSVITFKSATNPSLLYVKRQVQISSNGKTVWSCKYSDTSNVIGVGIVGGAAAYIFLTSSALTAISSWNNNNNYYDVDFQPNNSTILYGGKGTGGGSTLLIMSGNTAPPNFSPYGYGTNILAVSCARDFSYIVVGTNKSACITNTASPAAPAAIYNYSSLIWGVRASDDNDYVIVGTSSGQIDIYKRNCEICPIG
jgi:WD40 repeat protein